MGFDHKRTHEEVRACLCGLCYRRGELRKITEEQLSQLKNLVYKDYNLSSPRFQTVLCRNCVRVLSAHSKVISDTF